MHKSLLLSGLFLSLAQPVFVLVVVPPAFGATLRGATTLEGGQVRVGDLFDDAGTTASRVLGPGPAPGNRIVVEAAQLTAIARQFGVAWRAVSDSERIIIDRPGKLVPREDVTQALRTALVGVGGPEDADLELPGFQAPMVAMEAAPKSAIEQLDYEAATGRFTATLSVTSADMPVQRMRLAGRLQEMQDLPVAMHRLVPGTVIQPGDLHNQRVHPPGAGTEMVRDLAQAAGMTVRHVVAPGQPVPFAELVRPMAVLKGDRVTMQLQAPGLSLSGTGQALEPGAIGERISVLNPSSRAVVEAVVTGPGQVRVTPDSMPRPNAQRVSSAFQASLP